MIDHDGLFKRLLTTFLHEFLALFWPEVLAYTDLSDVVFLDKEFPATRGKAKKRAADLVARVKFRGQPVFFLFHIEPQSTRRKHFERRMFRYFAKLLDQYNLPIYPIAVFTFDSPRKEQTGSYEIIFPDFEVLRFNYRVVQLNNLSWRDFINHENPIATALMAKMRIAKKDRPRVKAQCLRMFLTMRLDEDKANLILEFIETYLALNEAEEKTFQRELATIAPELEEEAMEFMTSWERRARQEMLLSQLQHRFGKLPSVLQRHLKSLHPDQLEQLSIALFDFQAVADLATWLEQHSAKRKLQPNNAM